ncbi:MAG: hypothetical protein C0594_01640 [Marinilabiliales bacterium]|nr:MAG: hypothetical protein C0594_01640 [Marinilabiliales bacterium]
MKYEIFIWNESYCIGFEMIDKQHKELVSIINEIYSVFMNNQGINGLMPLFDKLTDYTRYHFTAEQKILEEKLSEEDFLDHLKKHEYFIMKIERMKSQLNDEGEKILFEIINFLRNWLQDHILIEDKEAFSQK